jgi:uncharacterized protein
MLDGSKIDPGPPTTGTGRAAGPVRPEGIEARDVHLLAKPTGSACNLDCTYCFFLSKEALYPDGKQRMSEHTLETYIRQLMESQRSPVVTVSWQGGEPTLRGLEFYRRTMALVERYRRPGQTVRHTIQTNGVLLDDRWCAFFKEHDFLVGLSVDGPREIHDAYRLNRGGRGSFEHVMRGWRHLRDHGVDYNVLCTVHAANQGHGRTVYRFLRDELEARFIQFIPIVERATPETLPAANRGWRAEAGEQRPLYTQTGTLVTDRSVGPEAYGRFLVDVYEEWIRRDVGEVFVQLFDVTLEAWFGRHTLCVHAPVCGAAPVLEHNGDLYSCDHFVEPDHRLGNIHETHLVELMATRQQESFGLAKRDGLTAQCRACEVRHLCHGGCPKDRFARSRDGETGHNYLCPGLELFFSHTTPTMGLMVELLRRNRAPSEIRGWMTEQDRRRGRYAPCTCGNGERFGFCHGRREQAAGRSGGGRARNRVSQGA